MNFMRHYADRVRAHASARRREQRPRRRSVDALVAPITSLSFRRSAEPREAMRRGILRRFCTDFGRDLVVNFEHKHIAAIINSKATDAARRQQSAQGASPSVQARGAARLAQGQSGRRNRSAENRGRRNPHVDRRRDRQLSRTLAARDATAALLGTRAGDDITPQPT